MATEPTPTPKASDISTTTPGQLLEERVATPADATPAPGATAASTTTATDTDVVLQTHRLVRVPRADVAAATVTDLPAPTAPLADDADFDPAAFVTAERFALEPGASRLWLPNTLDLAAAWPALVTGRVVPVAAVALVFPAYADGRAYSQARVLRRLGFDGELRATGAAVTSDQVHFMHRCGFDALELRTDQDVQACLAALRQFPDPYQTSADGAVPARVRRRPNSASSA